MGTLSSVIYQIKSKVEASHKAKEEPNRRMTSGKYGLYSHIKAVTKPKESEDLSEDLGADKGAIGVPKPRRGATKTMLSVDEILNISRKRMGV